jgi:hypothetical protein
MGPRYEPQFFELILDEYGPGEHELERRWRSLGWRRSERGMGCSCGRHGGGSRSAEFEQFQ